jgi:hypothetical protein
LLAFSVPFIVYLCTLCPTVYWQDSGEFVSVSYTLGIAHYSGYPTYTLIGRLFTLLPLGSIAFRVNLMSAFFASLSAVFVYLIMKLMIQDKVVSLISSWAFAFSYCLWTQAVIAEVYTLNAFFVALLIYLILKWNLCLGDKWLYCFSFVYGLSFTNHITVFLLIPAFSIFFLLNLKKLTFVKILLMLLLFAIGLLPYIYLPVRASMNPVLNWGNPSTLSNFINHVTGADFASQYLVTDLNRLLLNSSFILWVIMIQFPLFLGFGFLGFFQLPKYRKEFVLFILILISYFLFVLFFQSDIGSLLIPFFLVFSLIIGFGLNLLKEFMNRFVILSIKKKGIGLFLLFIILSFFPLQYLMFPKEVNKNDVFMVKDTRYLPVFFLRLFPPSVNKHYYHGAQDYANYVLNSLEKNAILLTFYDDDANPLLYNQIVEGRRKDIKIIQTTLLPFEWYVKSLKQQYPMLHLSEPRYVMENFVTENYHFPIYQTIRNPALAAIFTDKFNNETFPLNKVNQILSAN